MRAVSFLGLGNYSEACYVFDGRECRTAYFPVAVCELFGARELRLLMTAAARAKHFAGLQADLAARGLSDTVQAVEIPEGKSEAEIWELFDVLTGALPSSPDDGVLLDVTFGYRSLPVLAVIAAAYLQVARGVPIDKLVYGAWESPDDEGRTPVFDLSPFLTLLRWTTATEQFLRTGEAKPLTQALEAAHNLPHRASPSASDLPRQLKNVAGALDEVSQAMQLARPHAMMEAAATLAGRLETADSEARRWAKPFAVLLDRVRADYAPLALSAPLSDARRDLDVQRRLLDWYVERGRAVEAILLAREYVISSFILEHGWDVIADRDHAEKLLGDAAAAKRTKQTADGMVADGAAVPVDDSWAQLWNRIGDLRNDVAHCGMRRSPRPVRSILGDVARLPAQLDTLSARPAPGREGVGR